jgi:hypothetical protein
VSRVKVVVRDGPDSSVRVPSVLDLETINMKPVFVIMVFKFVKKNYGVQGSICSTYTNSLLAPNTGYFDSLTGDCSLTCGAII